MENTDQCQCQKDGFCPRFKREMRGRLREICRGIDIAPEAAGHYRQLWAERAGVPAPRAGLLDCPERGEELLDGEGKFKTRDCQGCGGRVRLKLFPCNHQAREPEEVTFQDCRTCAWRPADRSRARWVVLKNHLSPGDVLVMTAAVHSLARKHPGRFAVAVDSSCPAVWENNPDVVPQALALGRGAEVIQTHTPAINQSNSRAIHFMEAYCEFLEDALGVRVPLLTNRPLLYLSRREKSWLPQVEGKPYWVLNAGRKNCFTAKFWGAYHFQRLVDILDGKVRFVQAGSREHHHPRLRGVIDLVGQTDHRQFVRLCHHAQGGVGGVTFLQHVMAALDKPYACVMGGREPVPWNSYPRQMLFHTIGAMPCCVEGCWKSRTVPLGDGDEKDKSLCVSPQAVAGEAVPKCLEMIKPEEVAAAILKYLPGLS